MSDFEKQTGKVVELSKQAKTASERKWGVLAMKPGFVIIPSLLLKAQSRIGLNCNQLAILLHLSEFWWHDGKYPWPKKETLARRIGLKEKQVQRAVAELEKAGLVKRVPRMSKHGQTSNEYDLSGLVRKLAEIAPDFIEAAAQKRNVERSGSRLAKLKKA